ncbi:IS481 family transposase ISMav2 [bioreactor metagenome]|uniref:IS481 family transposase ISMav2 n=1 Tax=bioreactor metagenome TaxID=1076179 RepID=A0A645BFR5_9ZZZZ
MPKKNPDKREAKRLEKLEVAKQSLRWRAAEMVKDGLSLRKAGGILGMSHQFVKNWVDRLLEKKHVGKKAVYELRKGARDLVATQRPGPEPGRDHVCDKVLAQVVGVKERYPFLGAEKIKVISGAEASAPTIRKALAKAGHGPVTIKKGKAYKTFCARCPNEMWQIDYVSLDGDNLLSVIDDHSRKILSVNLRETATTDDVLDIITEAVETHGAPKRILSDHGVQWYASRGGDTRFDIFCEEHGIEHIMGQIRKPTTTGKVERWHGTIRREADLPPGEDIEVKKNALSGFIDFYNTQRPHYALGLRTPDEIYYKA